MFNIQASWESRQSVWNEGSLGVWGEPQRGKGQSLFGAILTCQIQSRGNGGRDNKVWSHFFLSKYKVWRKKLKFWTRRVSWSRELVELVRHGPFERGLRNAELIWTFKSKHWRRWCNSAKQRGHRWSLFEVLKSVRERSLLEEDLSTLWRCFLKN